MKQAKIYSQGKKRLQEWMRDNNFSMNDFAIYAKMHYRQVWMWTSGTNRPNLMTAARIERATEGFVPCISWTEEELPSKPKKSKRNANKQ
jgi:hypothetical protein